MKIKIVDISNNDVGEFELKLQPREYNDQLEHQIYLVDKYQKAKKRQGTRSVKNRSVINGGGAKPFKQKGTGRARRGTGRSPLIRGGAVIFGPSNRDFSININNKVIKSVIRSVMEQKKEKICLLDIKEQEKIKTKQLAALLKNDKNAVIMFEDKEENLYKAGRNIQNCRLLEVKSVQIEDVLRAEKVLVTVKAMKKMEEVLVI
ncbi:MAG: 50S ribosomal protein L4 [bacterium]|nr:50S ribosomal protein L4 [bacterium]